VMFRSYVTRTHNSCSRKSAISTTIAFESVLFDDFCDAAIPVTTHTPYDDTNFRLFPSAFAGMHTRHLDHDVFAQLNTHESCHFLRLQLHGLSVHLQAASVPTEEYAVYSSVERRYLHVFG
jgi:hypothetical protein